jgi:hypothetical protein
MKDSIRSKINKWSLIILILIIFIYGLFRIYPFIVGPVITLNSPYDGQVIPDATFLVTGKVTRAKVITLQGRPITIDKEGNFKETLVTHSPYTILVLEAEDVYGKRVKKIVNVQPEKVVQVME